MTWGNLSCLSWPVPVFRRRSNNNFTRKVSSFILWRVCTIKAHKYLATVSTWFTHYLLLNHCTVLSRVYTHPHHDEVYSFQTLTCRTLNMALPTSYVWGHDDIFSQSDTLDAPNSLREKEESNLLLKCVTFGQWVRAFISRESKEKETPVVML